MYLVFAIAVAFFAEYRIETIVSARCERLQKQINSLQDQLYERLSELEEYTNDRIDWLNKRLDDSENR